MSTQVFLNNLTRLLRSQRYLYASELELQDGIAMVLSGAEIEYTREFSLGSTGRLDFFLPNGVAIEIKTKGGRSELVRQVMRYTEDPQVTGVLVVTTRLQHSLPLTMAGKPVRLLTIPRAFA